jgi:hypothetical protein
VPDNGITWLEGLERTMVTISTRRAPAWPEGFPIAHLAEHLVGRDLARSRTVADLSGTIGRDGATVRFAAPGSRVRELARPERLHAIIALRDATDEDLHEELWTLSIEDELLPLPLRSRGRLPETVELLRASWAAMEPVVSVRSSPVLGPELAAGLRQPPSEPEEVPRPRGSGRRAGPRSEWDDAYADLCRRLRHRPELLMDGGAVVGQHSPFAVLFAGLSAYRSPLFQTLRRDRRHRLYSFNLYDFPWRHRRFVAFVAVPPLGRDAFVRSVGRRLAEVVAGLTPDELRCVWEDGVLRTLSDLDAALASPRERTQLRLLARTNGFGFDPGAAARRVLGRGPEELLERRREFLARLDRHLAGAEHRMG